MPVRIVPTMTRDQVRSVDKIAIEEFGMLGLVLMENAGRGAAQIIDQLYPEAKVVVLCGKGNNGGDGYVIARHLENLGLEVKILSVVAFKELAGDAAANARISVSSGSDISFAVDTESISKSFANADVIVDCLLGTGASGEPRGMYREAVDLANHASANRIAIDLPTGLDCDSGNPAIHTFQANHTITFVARKSGMDNIIAAPYLGAVHVVDIGVPLAVIDSVITQRKLDS